MLVICCYRKFVAVFIIGRLYKLGKQDAATAFDGSSMEAAVFQR